MQLLSRLASHVSVLIFEFFFQVLLCFSCASLSYGF
ncbi:hypothetical protein OIU78_024448 [Salix suchowensis]|nr:hypothetical protein OIU78_024448 [Salix suchowensis]